MKTPAEQRAGLLALDVEGATLVEEPGDVVTLVRGGREVVYAVGRYDGWGNGALQRSDMTAEEAAAYLRNAQPGEPPRQPMLDLDAAGNVEVFDPDGVIEPSCPTCGQPRDTLVVDMTGTPLCGDRDGHDPDARRVVRRADVPPELLARYDREMKESDGLLFEWRFPADES